MLPPTDRAPFATRARRRRRTAPDTSSSNRSRRLHHPRVELHPAADVDLRELDRSAPQRRDARRGVRVRFQRSDDLVTWQANQIRHRRRAERRIGVNRPTCAGGDVVRVRTARRRGRQPFGVAGPVEPRAPEKDLRRVRRRCVVVEPTALRVDVLDLHHVELAGRDEPHRAGLGDQVRVAPSVALGQENESRIVASQSTDGPVASYTSIHALSRSTNSGFTPPVVAFATEKVFCVCRRLSCCTSTSFVPGSHSMRAR